MFASLARGNPSDFFSLISSQSSAMAGSPMLYVCRVEIQAKKIRRSEIKCLLLCRSQKIRTRTVVPMAGCKVHRRVRPERSD
jgi:hypothetical protein